jgi:hypothetical protein
MQVERDLYIEKSLRSGSRPRLNRRSREYIRWLQGALNKVMGSRLAVDGIIGSQTRAVLRGFQSRAGLVVDGIPGPRSEAALVAAGANPPGSAPQPTPGGQPSGGVVPPPPGGRPSLSALNAFTRNFVRQFIAQGRQIDCADLAIETWIYFGDQYRLPVSFDVYDSSNRRYLVARRDGVRVKSSGALVKGFRTTPEFVRWVQGNVGARHLIGNTDPVPGGHRAGMAGDVFLWEYVNNRTQQKASIGHTQLLDEVLRSAGGPMNDRIRIVQGSLPAIVPVFREYPASFFYQTRQATIQGEPHTGVPVGNGPRRFKSFASLR